MISLAMLRHAATRWNAEGWLQGRADPPLSPIGIAQAEGWRLPAVLGRYAWRTSPLRRCRETAAILARNLKPPAPVLVEPSLIEMDWGQWEGHTLADLRRRHGSAMGEMEARGLDLLPPGGESPRQVQARLRPWLAAVGRGGIDIFAVSHKGVIRALYALSSGWDMLGRPPDRLSDAAVHMFRVSETGVPKLERANIALNGVGGEHR